MVSSNSFNILLSGVFRALFLGLKPQAQIGVGTKVSFDPPSEPDWQISCMVFRFRLLSTPSLDDAVAFRYGQTSAFCPMRTFTSLLVRTFRRTSRGPSGRHAVTRTPAGS